MSENRSAYEKEKLCFKKSELENIKDNLSTGKTFIESDMDNMDARQEVQAEGIVNDIDSDMEKIDRIIENMDDDELVCID